MAGATPIAFCKSFDGRRAHDETPDEPERSGPRHENAGPADESDEPDDVVDEDDGDDEYDEYDEELDLNVWHKHDGFN
jgi:hypothetical protein